MEFKFGSGAALVAVLIVFVFLFGCAAGQGASDGKNGSKDTTIGAKDSKDIIAENKSGSDKINETIKSAVADGTYSDNVTYTRPNGNEIVEFSVTVKDGVVTNASVKAQNPVPFSVKFIEGFNSELPTLVVGKKIDSLDIPKQVGGSSLTTAAFKGYVQSIVDKKQ